MTRQQETTMERLALAHGRVAVHDGYRDRAIRVTAPNGAHWIVGEGGNARDAGVNFSIDWST
jgi:hypothetical protein